MALRNHNTLKSWRLFIAIELPKNVRHEISQHIDHLRRELADVRASWTREHNLHLTLKFFGDTQIGKVELLSQALQRAANRVPVFQIELNGCGSFPPRGKPNVLWIGIEDPSGELQNLYKFLEDECAKEGFDRDLRPFHPHLTIARIRHPQNSRRLAELHQRTECDSLSVKVEDICLIRSELNSEGSRYTVIARHALND